MTETEQEHGIVVFASGKKLTMDEGKLRLGLHTARLWNPEAPASEHYQEEPDYSDPKRVTAHKLNQVLRLYHKNLSEVEKNKLQRYLASDVAYSIKVEGNHHYRERFHKVTRDVKLAYGAARPAIERKLARRYERAFHARWKLGMGAAVAIGEKHQKSIGLVTIEADFEALNADEIHEHYAPEANAGVDVVGIGIDRKISFYLSVDPASEPILCNTDELRDLVYSLIVAKVPTKGMYDALVQPKTEDDDAMAFFQFTAAHLLTAQE
jgi:hypothetical protein